MYISITFPISSSLLAPPAFPSTTLLIYSSEKVRLSIGSHQSLAHCFKVGLSPFPLHLGEEGIPPKRVGSEKPVQPVGIKPGPLSVTPPPITAIQLLPIFRGSTMVLCQFHCVILESVNFH